MVDKLILKPPQGRMRQFTSAVHTPEVVFEAFSKLPTVPERTTLRAVTVKLVNPATRESRQVSVTFASRQLRQEGVGLVWRWVYDGVMVFDKGLYRV